MMAVVLESHLAAQMDMRRDPGPLRCATPDGYLNIGFEGLLGEGVMPHHVTQSPKRPWIPLIQQSKF